MDAFFIRISDFIAAHGLLPRGSPVVAGVSGGADSLALLLVLAGLRETLDLKIQIAHLNHGLRGSDSDQDEAFVQEWGRRLKLDCAVRRVDVRALAEANKQGLEDAGRTARHAFFSELADCLDANLPAAGFPSARIALAHHLDDQAETVLLHLGRGSGLDGLTGIKPQNGRLIRPLLERSRTEIEAWLTAQGIIWRQDESNLELFTLRNRLRHQVLPIWQAALGHNPAPILARTAAVLDEDRQYLETMTQEAATICLIDGTLWVSDFIKRPAAVQNRLLRLLWRQQTGSYHDLSFTHVRLIRDWLPDARNGQHLCLPDNWKAVLDSGRLCLILRADSKTANVTQPAVIDPLLLNLPGITRILPLGKQIRADLIENADNIVYNDTTEYFHLERIKDCVVRHRQPGDRIRPFSHPVGKTLKKFLNEQQVMRDDRARLLIVACGQRIAWIPGLASGADFAARPGDGSTGPWVALTIQDLDREA